MSKIPLNTKFVIIGAGPAGMSTAIHLKKNGYNNITVLEKELDVGGKCLSFNYQDQIFDFGANLTTPRYNNIRALAQEVGLTLRELPQRRIVSVSKEPYVSPANSSFIKKLLIRAGALLYTVFRGLTKIDKPGYTNLRVNLEMPFEEWLKSYGLGQFAELFQVLFVSYGYGHLMNLPAAYALKFFDHIHLNASVDVVLGQEVSTTTDFKEGFQELWKRLQNKYEINVLTGVGIESIVRTPSGVAVNFDQSYLLPKSNSLSISSESLNFDKLILACPLQSATFLDHSEEEIRLFSKISTYEYYVTLVEVENLPPISTYVFPYAKKVSPGYPTVFYPPNETNMFLSYAYGGVGLDERTVQQRLRNTIEDPKIGGKVKRFVKTHKWQYFPHVSSKDMSEGFYDQLESLQGQFHTYYCGEIMSFTLTELIYDYCQDLVVNKILK